MLDIYWLLEFATFTAMKSATFLFEEVSALLYLVSVLPRSPLTTGDDLKATMYRDVQCSVRSGFQGVLSEI